MRFPFVGPTYTAQSKHADGERSINLYMEAIESPSGGKGGATTWMTKIPGLATFLQLPDKPLRCLFSGDSIRVFAVSGATLYELFQDGTFSALGVVEPSTSPAQIFSNGSQLFVVSGSGGYIANGVNVTKVVDCCMGGYLDQYFLGLDGAYPGTSKTFQISGLLDGNSWGPLDFANVDQSPDNIQALIVDHRQALFLKQQTAETYWDSGNPDFPLEPVEGSFVEQGCIAPWTPKKIDNTVMWLGGDERGAGVVWRLQGYTPIRVSNFAIENRIQGYTRAGYSITDAVSMVEQVQGHAFYHLCFPSVPDEPGLVYDCSNGQWHERGSWDTVNGIWHAHKARYHCYAWGKHLVGGGEPNGYVYDQSINYQTDSGDPLRWLRSSPHLADRSSKRIFFSNLFLDFQCGVGINSLVGFDGLPRNPVGMVRHSNDGGNNWGPETQLEMGKLGEFSRRVRQPMCGSGRDRCIEASGTDPVQISIVGADIDAELGTS